MQRKVIVIEENDNVATALTELEAGEVICVRARGERQQICLAEDIPFGHKVALVPVAAGDELIKYGHPIARAARDIEPGENVHVHNAEGQRGRGDLAGKGRSEHE